MNYLDRNEFHYAPSQEVVEALKKDVYKRQVRYSITYSTNLFSLAIGHRDTEFLFEFHDKFYSVKRISSQVVSEASFVSNF